MGKVLMDRNAPADLQDETQDSLRRTRELCEKWHGYDDGRLLYSFIPRFAVTSSRAQLSGIAKLWRDNPGTYMHTHLAESLEEVRMVQELFPHCRSYTDVYAKEGLVGERSIFAHSIHIDDDDIKTLKSSDSSIAHCPSSNFFLKSGRFRYDAVKQSGLRFGLGSDMAARTVYEFVSGHARCQLHATARLDFRYRAALSRHSRWCAGGTARAQSWQLRCR